MAQPTAIDNNCLGITPKEQVSTDWLYLVLSSIDFAKYQAGTSVPALSQGTLAKIPVCLPGLAEQHRIVAKVDELMALCDRLEQQQADSEEAHQTLIETLLSTLTQTPVRAEPVEGRTEFEEAWTRIADHFDTLFTTEHSIDQLKQTILQLAVMGKLVPQDPNEESADVLLARIAKEREKLAGKRMMKPEKKLRELCEEEIPFPPPNGWAWTRLGKVSQANTGYAFKSTEYTDSGTFVLRVTNINPDGSINNDDNKYIDATAAQGTYKKFALSAGDILLVMVGAA